MGVDPQMGALTITVTDVDNFDWDGDSRPDHNFNGVTIPVAGSLKQREEINSNAIGIYYTLTLTWGNGVSNTLRMDQGKCTWDEGGRITGTVLSLVCSGN